MGVDTKLITNKIQPEQYHHLRSHIYLNASTCMEQANSRKPLSDISTQSFTIPTIVPSTRHSKYPERSNLRLVYPTKGENELTSFGKHSSYTSVTESEPQQLNWHTQISYEHQ